MDTSIGKLLRKHYTDSAIYTHVNLRKPKGKYQFDRRGIENLWDLWCDELDINELDIGLAERPQNYLPILVDIDLKVNEDKISEDRKTLYTKEHISTVVEVYQSTLRNVVYNCSDRMLTCLLLEKPFYKERKGKIVYIKNGFHLHFPYIFLSKIDQEVYVIPEVRKHLTEMNTFSDLGFEGEESIRKIVDDCTKKSWLMYGSKKEDRDNVEMQSYVVTNVYDSSGDEISLEKALQDYRIYDSQEKEIEIKGRVKYYLPRILSILPYGRDTQEVRSGVIPVLKRRLPKIIRDKVYNNTIPVEEALRQAKSLLGMLEDFRAEDYNDWMTVGWALYNIGDGCEEALNLWLEFSSRCEDKYDEGRCIHEWERMVQKDVTLGTLKYFAKKDNPNLYKEYVEKISQIHVKDSLHGSHNDIAKALYTMYGHEFVCADISGNRALWFQYTNHRWKEIQGGIYLRRRISDQIVQRYIEMGKDIMDKLGPIEDAGEKAMYNVRLKQVQKLVMCLKQAPYKNNVMKECLSKGTLVSTSTGLSIPIEKLVENQRVLSWNGRGVVIGNQTDHIPKGKRECLQVTLQDGTTLVMTSDHKVLVENEWKEVKDLQVGNTLNLSLKQPQYVYTKPKNIWSLKVGKFTFTNKTDTEFKQALAFARMLGYILTDGTISVRKTNVNCVATIALKMDATAFVDDIELITGIRPKIGISMPNGKFVKSKQYTIALPNKLTRGIITLSGIPIGRRVEQSESIPDFILDKNCPEGVIKEFLAGLWGGDGYVPSFNKNQGIMRSTKFSQSKLVKHESSLTEMMENMKELFQRVGLRDISYRTSKYFSCGKRDDKCVENQLLIGMKEYLLFTEKIGVRYCTEKSLYLNLFATYRRMREITEKQYNLVVDRILELVNGYEIGKRKGIKYVIDQAHQEICKEEIVLNPEIIKPNYSTLIRQIQTGKTGHKFSKGLKIEDFLNELNALYVFEKGYVISQDDEFIPTFPVKIVDIREVGEREVYDITVAKHHSFIANGFVVHNCVETFYDERFLQKLDKNPYLFGFNNGVYDLKNNVFRDGKPEDFISKQSSIDYVEMHEDDEVVQDVYDFLEKVFPDKSIRQYFLDMSCGVFEGGNSEKKVPFWVGDGDNAKSVTQSFFEKMLGPYAIKIPTTVITSKKPPTGSAIPELARAGNGVRWATLEEPDENESINIGIFKHLSGNDSFFVRGLYQSGGEITPFFKLIFVCNKAPKVTFSDQAFWNRVRVIPFESTFCEDAPETFEEQLRDKKFPIDRHFDKKISGMIQAFAWVLLNHRKGMTNIVEPEKVKLATARYRRANDILRQFIEECVSENDDEKSVLSLTEIYGAFKEWFRESMPNHPVPIKNTVKEYFIKLWGEPHRGIKWKGYKIVLLEDAIQRGDMVEISEEDLVNYEEKLPPI